MKAQRSLALLFLVAAWLIGAPHSADARQELAFSTPVPRDLTLPEFADRQVASFVAALDSALLDANPAPSADAARHTLWSFARGLQSGRLTPTQESSVLDHLGRLGRSRPDYRESIDRAGFMIRSLTIGKTAPELTGQDLDGTAFRLSDYRGKVVVLTFSAEWCAICRSQHPYYRLMQELYANWPFAILGVETGAPESARRLKLQHSLTYRSWGDGIGGRAGGGALSSAYNVLGWPTTYVLDADGIIRFVDLRDEDLLKGVRQLLTEHLDRLSASALRQRH